VSEVASHSAIKVHAHGRAQAHATPAARWSEPAASAPFASLLDDPDGTPAQQPPQGGPTDAQPAQAAATAEAPRTPPSAKIDPAPARPSATDAADAADAAAAVLAATTDGVKPAVAAAPAEGGTTSADKTDTSKEDAEVTVDSPQPAADQTIALPTAPSAIADAAAAAAAAAGAAAPADAGTNPAPPAPAAPSPATTAVAPAVASATQSISTAPALIAAAAAQTTAPLDPKAETAKPTAADNKIAVPAAAEDEAVPPPTATAQAATAPDAKVAPAAADKGDTPKHDAHQARSDATATFAANGGGAAPAGADTSGAQTAAATAGTATGHAATTSAATPTPNTQPMPQGAPVPIAGLAVEIAARAHAGKNNFAIRLDPPELGRIEVKLSVDRQGQVTSHLIADRSDTLDLLRRDASGLTRALQDAGLKTAGDGLQFSLRDQSFSGQQNGGGRRNAAQIVAQDDTLPIVDVAASRYARFAGRIGGVDIRV
jgi:flagellar hook-length control protein FliK